MTHAAVMTTNEIRQRVGGRVGPVVNFDGPERSMAVYEYPGVGHLLVQVVTNRDGFQDDKRWTLAFLGTQSESYWQAATYGAVVVARDMARITGDIDPDRIGNGHDAYDAFN